MSSAVDICNLALAHLGDEANVSSISPPEGSAQAEHCARYYPIARRALLEMHNWSFSTRRVVLSEIAEDPPSGWMFAYGLPSQCLKPLQVLPPESTHDLFAEDFTVESLASGSKVIYSNTENASLIYTVDVTDTSRFTPLFSVALSRLLASYIAGPLIKGTEGLRVSQAQFEVFFKVEFPHARSADANARQVRDYDKFKPSGVKARE